MDGGKDLTLDAGITLTAWNHMTLDGSVSCGIFNNTGGSITMLGY